MEMASKQQSVEEARELASGYEKKCTGCAQSVVAGVLDALKIDSDDLFKAASGLADGIGLTGDGSCGALTGGAMVLGLLFGRERKDHEDIMKPMQSYLLCKELHGDFIDRYESCRCRDIQMKLMGRTFDMYDPGQLKEAFELGMLEHCAGVVGLAAQKTAEIALRERSDQA